MSLTFGMVVIQDCRDRWLRTCQPGKMPSTWPQVLKFLMRKGSVYTVTKLALKYG